MNTVGSGFNAFISPDETFLIFSGYQREDGLGSGDLYRSFKDPVNSWTQAVNLGDPYNSPQMDYCPYIELENDLIYFTSKGNLLEVDPEGFENLESFMTEVHSYPNGLNGFYKLPFKVLRFSNLLYSK